jgi:hypothetical protein
VSKDLSILVTAEKLGLYINVRPLSLSLFPFK